MKKEKQIRIRCLAVAVIAFFGSTRAATAVMPKRALVGVWLGDGQVLKGELLDVKEKSLVLLDGDDEQGRIVDLNQIVLIRMQKKPGFAKA